jgi:hypothetical protein
MKDIVIIAPHPDDEIIGCYEVIKNAQRNVFIVYNPTDDIVRQKEVLKLRSSFPQIKSQFFLNEIPPALLHKNNVLYYPCREDTHPSHQKHYEVGRSLWMEHDMDVVFYSTEMNVHYKHEVEDWIEKRKLLNHIYSSQSSLWQTDARYYYFEARIKYMK